MGDFNVKKKLSEAALLITILLASFGVGGGFKNVLNLLPKKTKASIQKNYMNYKQNYDESIRKAQKRLDKIREHQNYGYRCDMSDEENINDLVNHLEDNLGFEIANPLDDEEVREFTEEITEDEPTLERKARKFFEFIYEKSRRGATGRYSVTEMIKNYKKAKKSRKRAKLDGDCFSLSKLFVAGMRSIKIEAYICEPIKDCNGKDMELRFVNKEFGTGHICSIIKIKNKYVIVDVTEKKGFGFPYKEIKVKNDLEVITYYLSGRSFKFDQEENYQQSIKDLNQAISINPYDASLYFNLAMTYLKDFKPNKAFLPIINANKLKPDSFRYIHGLALVYADLEKYEIALEKIKESLELCPDYASAHNTCATILFELGRYKSAKKQINKALSIKPYKKSFLKNLKMINKKLSPSWFD